MEKKRLIGIFTFIILSFLWLPICYSQVNSEAKNEAYQEIEFNEKVIMTCNKIIQNIHNDIFNIKDEYRELTNYSKETMTKRDGPRGFSFGTNYIIYAHDYVERPKTTPLIVGDVPILLKVIIDSIEYAGSWQYDVSTMGFQQEYPNINTAVLVLIWTKNKDLEDRIIKIIRDRSRPLEEMDR